MSHSRVLITGATGMTGSLLARKALDAGYEVRAMIRSPDKKSLFDGLNVEFCEADLSEPAGREALLERLTPHDPPVQVLVNNAGVATSAPLLHTDDALWARTVELNLEPSEGHSLFEERIYGPATEVVPAYVARLLAEGG